MIHWFGKPVTSVGYTDKVSFLELDVDDLAFFSCKMGKDIRVNFEIDFYSPININYGEAYTLSGKYFWDTQGIYFVGYNSTEVIDIIKFSAEELNHMYVNQMKDFINFIESGKSKNATFNESVSVLEIINEIEKEHV
jgi:hypothetical protein